MNIKEIYQLAKQNKYSEFENILAEKFFNRPSTEVTTHLTDKLVLCVSSLHVKDKQIPTFEEFVKTFESKEWYAEHLYLTDNGWVSISLILDKYIREESPNL